MPMSEGYRNAIGTHGGTLITHLGLVNVAGTELTGGSPAYARQAVTWAAAAAGIIRPNADLTFNIPAATTVAGFRGFSALVAGTNYGGEALANEVYTNQGTYKLLAASTGVKHLDPA